eukprot:scaffold91472_cov31-Tisochrysis_lutea.AAC.3
MQAVQQTVLPPFPHDLSECRPKGDEYPIDRECGGGLVGFECDAHGAKELAAVGKGEHLERERHPHK